MATLTITTVSANTNLVNTSPDTSSSQPVDIQVKKQPSVVRAIIEFDIANLPPNISVTSATLSLYAYWVNNTEGRTYWVNKLTRTDWAELQATWNKYKTDTSWTNAGGDFVSSNPAAASASVPAVNNWMDFNVQAIVQDAHDNFNPFVALIHDAIEGGGGGVVSTLFSYLTAKLVIVYSESPSVATLPTTDIAGTTATGNGIINSIGLSSVTEHGHCWAITIDPTTSNSKTTNGAGSLGVFTSSITGLILGRKYFVRAYATNTEGTGYGANSTFIAGHGNTQLKPFDISIVQSRLHYVDADGKERYIEGTPTF